MSFFSLIQQNIKLALKHMNITIAAETIAFPSLGTITRSSALFHCLSSSCLFEQVLILSLNQAILFQPSKLDLIAWLARMETKTNKKKLRPRWLLNYVIWTKDPVFLLIPHLGYYSIRASTDYQLQIVP